MLVLTPVLDDDVDPKLWAGLLMCLTLVGLIKLVFALVLPLGAHEAVWISYAQNLNLTNPHSLPVYPALLKGISTLLGESVLSWRLGGWLIGAILPLVVVWAARPLVGLRQAVWAGLVSLVLPPLTLSGVRVGVDSLLALETLVIFGLVIRTLNSKTIGLWLLCGFVIGIGICTDPRMVLLAASLLMGVVVLSAGRSAWRHPPFLLAFAISLWGFWPYVALLSQGLMTGLPSPLPLSFEKSFLGLFLGLLLITPLMVYGFVKGFQIVYRRALNGQGLAGATLVFMALPTAYGVVLLALGQIDLPLLAMLSALFVIVIPAATEAFLVRAPNSEARRIRLGLVCLAPVWALFTVTSLGLYQVAWAAPDRFLPKSEQWRLKGEFASWQAVKRPVESLLDSHQSLPHQTVVAVGGHEHAARIAQLIEHQAPVYHLATPADLGTAHELRAARWGQGEEALMGLAPGTPVVLALKTPDQIYDGPADTTFRTRLCQRFDTIEPAGQVTLAPGRERVALYTAYTRAEPRPLQAGCPLFPDLYIHSPGPGEVLPQGPIRITGLASAMTGIAKLEVVLDGQPLGIAHYGFAPDDITVPPALRFDPMFPELGFAYELDTRALRPGAHVLSLRATRVDGREVNGAEQTIYIR